MQGSVGQDCSCLPHRAEWRLKGTITYSVAITHHMYNIWLWVQTLLWTHCFNAFWVGSQLFFNGNHWGLIPTSSLTVCKHGWGELGSYAWLLAFVDELWITASLVRDLSKYLKLPLAVILHCKTDPRNVHSSALVALLTAMASVVHIWNSDKRLDGVHRFSAIDSSTANSQLVRSMSAS